MRSPVLCTTVGPIILRRARCSPFVSFWCANVAFFLLELASAHPLPSFVLAFVFKLAHPSIGGESSGARLVPSLCETGDNGLLSGVFQTSPCFIPLPPTVISTADCPLRFLSKRPTETSHRGFICSDLPPCVSICVALVCSLSHGFILFVQQWRVICIHPFVAISCGSSFELPALLPLMWISSSFHIAEYLCVFSKDSPLSYMSSRVFVEVARAS